MVEKIEKKNQIKYSNPNQKEYRDRLARALKLIDDHEERYNKLQNQKITNKMYIETARDGSLSKELAFCLIENRKWNIVVDNIKKFKQQDYKEIADLLIETKQSCNLTYKIKDFKWLDHNYVLQKIIEKKKLSAPSEYAITSPSLEYNYLRSGYFEWLNKETAKLLIEVGENRVLLENLKSFKWLDKEIFLHLLKWVRLAGEEKLFFNNMDSFEWLDKESAKRLIKIGEKRVLLENLKSFRWLDEEIFLHLLKWARTQEDKSLLHNRLDSFEWLDEWLVEKDSSLDLKDNKLENEKITNKMYIETARDGSLSKEIAFDFIENKKRVIVVDNIKKFKQQDHKEIADLFIEKWYYRELGRNRKDFEWLNHNNIVKKAIQKTPWKIRDLLDNNNFEWLNKETAKLLIEVWEERVLLENLKSFRWLDKEIFLYFYEWDYSWDDIILLFRNMEDMYDTFEWLDKEVAKLLIETWQDTEIFSNSFDKEIFDKEIARLIIDKNKDSWFLSHELWFFKWLDKEIADLLIKDWYIESVAQNLNSFEKLGEEIKNLLIEKWYELYVEMYPDKF